MKLKIGVGVLVLLVLVLFGAVGFQQNLQNSVQSEIRKSSHWVAHTFDAVLLINEVRAASLRYSNQKNHDELVFIRIRLRDLNSLISDNIVQVERTNKLSEMFSQEGNVDFLAVEKVLVAMLSDEEMLFRARINGLEELNALLNPQS